MRIFKIKHEILDFECDMSGKLMIPNILSLAIMGSTKQALEYGVGPDYTHDMGLGWIVLQHKINVKRRPMVGETIIIQTRAKEFNQYFSTRDYIFLDKNNNEIIQIDSMYAVIDMKKRKMVRIPEALVQVYNPKLVKRITHFDKPLQFLDDEKVEISRNYRVRFSDIDSNKHVNNAKYLDWSQDILGSNFLLRNEPKFINIKFKHEVLLDEIVNSKVIKKYDITKHQILVEDELAAEVEIKWTKK